MQRFTVLSVVLSASLFMVGSGTKAQSENGVGGIRLLSHLPQSELEAEDLFWRSRLAPVANCEAAADTAIEGSVVLGSGCAPGQRPRLAPPPPDQPGA